MPSMVNQTVERRTSVSGQTSDDTMGGARSCHDSRDPHCLHFVFTGMKGIMEEILRPTNKYASIILPRKFIHHHGSDATSMESRGSFHCWWKRNLPPIVDMIWKVGFTPLSPIVYLFPWKLRPISMGVNLKPQCKRIDVHESNTFPTKERSLFTSTEALLLLLMEVEVPTNVRRLNRPQRRLVETVTSFHNIPPTCTTSTSFHALRHFHVRDRREKRLLTSKLLHLHRNMEVIFSFTCLMPKSYFHGSSLGTMKMPLLPSKWFFNGHIFPFIEGVVIP